MKKITVIFAMAMIAMSAWAQADELKDVIYTTDNKTIEAKVVEVSSQEVKYKDWNNQSGPMFILTAKEIKKIEFSNGTEKTFAALAEVAPATPVTTEEKAEAKTASPAKKTDQKLHAGFQFNIDVDGNLAFVNGWSMSSYRVDNYATGGVNVCLGAGVRIADWMYFGAAAGVIGEWGNTKVRNNTEEYKAQSSQYAVPIYADVRAYAPTHGNCFPYVEVGIGGFVGLDGKVKCADFELDKKPEGGFYFISGVGLEFKYLNIGAGYKLLRNNEAIGNHGYVKLGISIGRCNKLRNK